MKVEDVMTKNPSLCSLSTSAQTAAGLMQQKDTGVLPVTEDAFSRKLVGIVTDRDLCASVVAAGRDTAHIWVHECMTPDPVSCNPQDEIAKVLRLMKERQVRRIPVVNARNEIVGMVSIGDLVRHRAIDARELHDLMARVCAPRPAVRKARVRAARSAA